MKDSWKDSCFAHSELVLFNCGVADRAAADVVKESVRYSSIWLSVTAMSSLVKVSTAPKTPSARSDYSYAVFQT